MSELNRQAFLDMIARSELGPLVDDARTDRGYRVIVGSTPSSPILMDSYADHPRKLVRIRANLFSTAAGRYQILARNFDAYRVQLQLSDFSPSSQDRIALQMIAEAHALPFIDDGELVRAIALCSHLWASLPGAGYGQRENELAELEAAYIAAGGELA